MKVVVVVAAAEEVARRLTRGLLGWAARSWQCCPTTRTGATRTSAKSRSSARGRASRGRWATRFSSRPPTFPCTPRYGSGGCALCRRAALGAPAAARGRKLTVPRHRVRFTPRRSAPDAYRSSRGRLALASAKRRRPPAPGARSSERAQRKPLLPADESGVLGLRALQR
eukprot:scaffold2175_cov381-Prasinococcus_capsulatus_cf.AAC.7